MNNGDRIIFNFKDIFDSLTQEQKVKYLDDHGFEYQRNDQNFPSVTQKVAYGSSAVHVVSKRLKKRSPYARRKAAMKKNTPAKKIMKAEDG